MSVLVASVTLFFVTTHYLWFPKLCCIKHIFFWICWNNKFPKCLQISLLVSSNISFWGLVCFFFLIKNTKICLHINSNDSGGELYPLVLLNVRKINNKKYKKVITKDILKICIKFIKYIYENLSPHLKSLYLTIAFRVLV